MTIQALSPIEAPTVKLQHSSGGSATLQSPASGSYQWQPVPSTGTSSSLANGASITVTHPADTANLRLCSAVYDSAAGDNTVLLLNFDGANDSTTITDESFYNRTMTAVGNAKLSTTNAKFGSACGVFDGTGDYITAPASADFDFGTGDLTIALWVRFASVAATQDILSHYGAPSGWAVRFINTGHLRIIRGADVVSDIAWSPSANTYYHIEIAKVSGSLRAFIDGTQIGTTISDSNSWTTSASTSLQIGRVHTVSTADLNGRLDSLLLMKGTGLHTGNFTAPTVAYSAASAIKNTIICGQSGISGLVVAHTSSTTTTFTNNTGATLRNVTCHVDRCFGV